MRSELARMEAEAARTAALIERDRALHQLKAAAIEPGTPPNASNSGAAELAVLQQQHHELTATLLAEQQRVLELSAQLTRAREDQLQAVSERERLLTELERVFHTTDPNQITRAP